MTLLCPRCRVDLQERPAHELTLFGCTRCGGVWLDNAGVKRLSAALSSKTLAAVDAVASAASKKGDETRPIDCPRCAEILLCTPIAKAGVSIDRCPDHGAWYDRNELLQVARALGTAPLAPKKSEVQKSAAPAPKLAKPPAKTPPKLAAPAPAAAPGRAAKSPAAKSPATKSPAAAPGQRTTAPPAPAGENKAALLGLAELILEVALAFF